MATKLFLRNTTNNGISGYYDMIPTAGSSSDTGVVNTTASGTEIQWTKTAGGTAMAWITGPVQSAFTLTTTDLSIWAHENNMSANCGGRYRLFKYSEGSETELTGGPFDDGVEFGTVATEMTWIGNPTDTAFAVGDRLVLKLYITNVGTMATGFTCTVTFNAADGATGDSFLNLNENVTFGRELGGINFASSQYQRGNIKLLYRNDPTLVGYYRLDNNPIDESGNGNHLTETNSPGYSRLSFGIGADFGASNTNKRFVVTNDLTVDGANCTIGCWAMSSADLASNTDAYFAILQDNTTKTEYGLSAFNNAGTFQAIAARTNVGVEDSEVRVTKKFEIGKPYFICLTYDGSRIAFYINNQLQGKTIAAGTGTGTTTTEFDIGARNRSGTPGSFFSGKIDEVFVFKRALSEAEIDTYYRWAIGQDQKSRYIFQPDAAPAGQQPFFMMLGVGS